MPAPGFSGRKAVLNIGGVGSIPITEKNLTINNEMIDVTSDTSQGWTTYLAEPGNKSVELGFNGVVADLSLLYSAFSNTSQIYQCTVTYPEGSVISGNFSLGSVGNTMPTKEATTFEASMASDGVVTFTPGV